MFRAFNLKGLVGLFVLVFLLSGAAASTSMLLSGSSGAFLSSLGGGADVVVLSGGGRVAQTGAISLQDFRNASRVPGVEALSPEVFAPALMGNRVVVVRGVNVTQFEAVQQASSIGGLGALSPGEVYVGSSLARSAGLSVGGTIALRGLLADYSSSSKVAGVVSFGPPYDDEVISSLQTARALRGLSSDQVTLLRMKVDPATFNSTLLMQALQGRSAPGASSAPPNPLIQQLQLAPTSVLVSVSPSGSVPPSLNTLLGRGLGLTESLFKSMYAVVLIASLLAVYFATSLWIGGARESLETLSGVGMARRRLVLWLLGVSVPMSVVAGLLGYISAYVVVRAQAAAGTSQFFFHSLAFSPDAVAIATSLIGPALIVGVSVIVSARGLKPRGEG